MTSWYSLVPRYCSEAVGALLRAAARPGTAKWTCEWLSARDIHVLDVFKLPYEPQDLTGSLGDRAGVRGRAQLGDPEECLCHLVRTVKSVC